MYTMFETAWLFDSIVGGGQGRDPRETWNWDLSTPSWAVGGGGFRGQLGRGVSRYEVGAGYGKWKIQSTIPPLETFVQMLQNLQYKETIHTLIMQQKEMWGMNWNGCFNYLVPLYLVDRYVSKHIHGEIQGMDIGWKTVSRSRSDAAILHLTVTLWSWLNVSISFTTSYEDWLTNWGISLSTFIFILFRILRLFQNYSLKIILRRYFILFYLFILIKKAIVFYLVLPFFVA